MLAEKIAWNIYNVDFKYNKYWCILYAQSINMCQEEMSQSINVSE